MKESDIDLKLIHDVIRLLTQAEAWGSKSPKSWNARAQFIASKLNSNQEREVLDMLHAAEKSGGGKGYGPLISEAYASNTKTLLQYRAATPHTPAHTVHLLPPDRAQKAKSIENLRKRLATSQGASTLMGYHALEEAGGLKQLRAILEQQLQVPVTLEIVPVEPAVYRVKARYRGHSPWLTYQLMPAIVVRMENIP